LSTSGNQHTSGNQRASVSQCISGNQRADDDREDAARVIAGDTEAFEGIVRRWQSPLINLAYRFCRDRGRAEEMAQEAFLRAFRNLASWRQESSFSTWLFALATNLYCSGLRRIPPISLPFDETHEPSDPRAIDGGLEERNRNAAIHHAVQNLPAKYREVLTLYYFHERDVPSTARSLGLPEGTVKAHLFRARNMLREKLRPLVERRTAAEPGNPGQMQDSPTLPLTTRLL
jgi:RNA polymerase sigma-70 factor (ECF subfamily)